MKERKRAEREREMDFVDDVVTLYLIVNFCNVCELDDMDGNGYQGK